MKPGDLKLAYLLVTSPVPNVYVGGLMVTDARGLPVEFRYTEPIQPTKLQQILYGQVLSSYIKREVILETLIKSIESRFKCLVVEDEQLLDYPARGYSVLRVSPTKSSPIGAVGATQELSPQEIILQVTPESSPIRVMRSVHERAAVPVGGGEAEDGKSTDATGVLLEAGQTMDIVEPLKRIEKALEIICQEAGISQTTAK